MLNHANALVPARLDLKSVLIIDDSKLFQRVIAKLVEHEEASVCGVAESGKTGAEMAIALQPDLMIIDHNMPDMDGVACLRAIRAQYQGGKVIVCSGTLTAQLSQDYLLLGANSLFSKPVALPAFLRALRQGLGREQA